MNYKQYSILNTEYDFDDEIGIFDIDIDGEEYLIQFNVSLDQLADSGIGLSYTVAKYIEDEDGELSTIDVDINLNDLLGDTWFLRLGRGLVDYVKKELENDYNGAW